jgi:Fur family ferric uptake transcriptional regulator
MSGNDVTDLLWLQNQLKNQGYRLTDSRKAILDILTNTDEHLSAEDIYMKVHADYPGIGLTTVYRTLELLVKLGMIFKFDFGDSRARYELAYSPRGMRHHHHLVCTNCGRIIDYTDFIKEEIDLLQKTEAGLSKKYNFKITNHLIQFSGVCSECRGKEK